ncbi:MAG: hypothetical protein JWM31_2037 [Solirubrobacterales bacterium]|nr:hypothetical protein [Solirubrobacterales bacterium]
MSPRVNVRLDEPVQQALIAAAALRGCRPATLAGELLTGAILTRSALDPAPSANPAPAASTPGSEVGGSEGQDEPASSATRPGPNRALWLQLDRSREWQHDMWNAVERLRHDYPHLGSAVDENWHTRRYTRDGLIALAVWRAELDTGRQADPRLEHQWQHALRDFQRQHDDIRRSLRGAVERHQAPDAW